MKNKLLMIIAILAFMVAIGSNARKTTVPKMYMFGIAASFNDTIIHFTDIQTLDSVWIDTKNNFLQERESYSYQLRDYLAVQEQLPQRTCIVFYNVDRTKLEKRYEKMKRLYGKGKDCLSHYYVRHLDAFRFTTIDLSQYYSEPAPTDSVK